MKKTAAAVIVILLIAAAVFFLHYRQIINDRDLLKEVSAGNERNFGVLFHNGNYDGYYYDRLDKVSKQAYAAVVENILAFPDKIEVLDLSNDQLNKLLCAVIYDNPEFFMFKKCLLSYSKDRVYFKPEYLLSKDEYEQKTAMIKEIVDDIGLAYLDGDDYQKELFCHDYLMDRCSYTDNDKNGIDYNNIYGALCDGSANCSGYAKALKLLLDKAGIDNFLVVGMAKTGDQPAESHMWNCVKIENSWCYVDLTWDDAADLAGKSYPRHNYFNVTDDIISVSHFDYEVDVDCVDDSYYYYKVRGGYFDKDLKNLSSVVTSLIVDSVKNKNYEIQLNFADKKLLKKALDELIDGDEIYRCINKANKQSKTQLVTTFVKYSTDNEGLLLTIKFDVKD